MSNKLISIAIGLMFSLGLAGAVKFSTGNGAWTTNGTWSPSGQPACGDSVIILAGHTVSITAQVDYTGCSGIIIVTRGVLFFSSGNKLKLPCTTKMYFMPGGRLSSDGSGNSNQLLLCGTAEWRGSDGTVNGPTCIPASLPGCNNVLLPIELSYFKATYCEEQVCLLWQTMREKDNDRFEIERSGNGYEFKTIKTVRSKAIGGNSIQALLYETTDRPADGDILYYRLKQVDFDGTESFSDIVALYRRGVFLQEFLVYPNPTTGDFNMQLKGLTAELFVTYTVLNSLGQVVISGSAQPVPGSEILTISQENKPVAGSYLIIMNAGEKRYSKKLMIQ